MNIQRLIQLRAATDKIVNLDYGPDGDDEQRRGLLNTAAHVGEAGAAGAGIYGAGTMLRGGIMRSALNAPGSPYNQPLIPRSFKDARSAFKIGQSANAGDMSRMGGRLGAYAKNVGSQIGEAGKGLGSDLGAAAGLSGEVLAAGGKGLGSSLGMAGSSILGAFKKAGKGIAGVRMSSRLERLIQLTSAMESVINLNSVEEQDELRHPNNLMRSAAMIGGGGLAVGSAYGAGSYMRGGMVGENLIAHSLGRAGRRIAGGHEANMRDISGMAGKVGAYANRGANYARKGVAKGLLNAARFVRP